METNTKKNIITWEQWNARSSYRDQCRTAIFGWLSQICPELSFRQVIDSRKMNVYMEYAGYLCAIGEKLYPDLNMPLDREQIAKDILSVFFYNCNHCGMKAEAGDCLTLKSGAQYCYNCAGNQVIHCENCGFNYLENDPAINLYLRTEGGITYRCLDCPISKTKGGRVSHRGYVSEMIGSGTGIKVQSPRAWSTEIECYLTNPAEFSRRLKKLPKGFGVAHDGSLVNDGSRRENGNIQTTLEDGRVLLQGIEIQTPILRGQEGEEYLTSICRALNAKDNAYVDNTCGLHIHLDMNDIYRNAQVIQKILVFHWLYEPVIMSFLPANRRANIYTQSLKNDYQLKGLTANHSLSSLSNYWYKKTRRLNRYNKKHTRYHGINMHSLFEQGHMEIRYHSGTTNAKKIFNWINLHTRIVDYCLGSIGGEPKISTMLSTGLTAKNRPVALSKLTRQMFEALQLSEECMEYFKDRQKKFKGNTTTFEAQFIEKEEQNDEEIRDPNSTQLTLPEYMERLSKLKLVK